MDEPIILPVRRSIRLKHFDYAQPGMWFVTVCSHGKKSIFGKIVLNQMKPNALGRIVSECWLDIPRHFPHVQTLAHVAMPNHFHGIFVIRPVPRARHAVPLQDDDMVVEMYQRPVAGSVPTIVRSFKSAVSKRIRQILRNPEFQPWQRNYYESRIRNEHEFRNARRYILENPAHWRRDSNNPETTATCYDPSP